MRLYSQSYEQITFDDCLLAIIPSRLCCLHVSQLSRNTRIEMYKYTFYQLLFIPLKLDLSLVIKPSVKGV
jgi:hypothetical protein